MLHLIIGQLDLGALVNTFFIIVSYTSILLWIIFALFLADVAVGDILAHLFLLHGAIHHVLVELRRK